MYNNVALIIDFFVEVGDFDLLKEGTCLAARKIIVGTSR